MKSWLIVLAPIVLFGVLMGMGVMKVPGVNDKPKAKAAAKQTKEDVKASDPKKDVSKEDSNKNGPAKQGPTSKPERTEVKVDVKSKPLGDEAKGNQKLAELWNSLETEPLLKVVESWDDADLAKVLAVMDTDKVAQLLTSMANYVTPTPRAADPAGIAGALPSQPTPPPVKSRNNAERASKLSKELRRLASLAPTK
jgi:hypothetical protein